LRRCERGAGGGQVGEGVFVGELGGGVGVDFGFEGGDAGLESGELIELEG